MEIQHTPAASKPAPSAEELLDKLIQILIHEPESSADWLEAISTNIEYRAQASSAIEKIVHTGSRLGVPKEITYKIINAIIKVDGLQYPCERISPLIETSYVDAAKLKEIERRER